MYWSDGRVAEGTGLLNLRIRKDTDGSNPSRSVDVFGHYLIQEDKHGKRFYYLGNNKNP